MISFFNLLLPLQLVRSRILLLLSGDVIHWDTIYQQSRVDEWSGWPSYSNSFWGIITTVIAAAERS